MELTQQNKTDLLEVVIILAMFFLIIVIYVPVAIWEEEEYYQDLSRYRMQNVYDIESFYSRLTGEYNPNFLEAMSVVNATRDSAIADSLFIGEQNVKLNGKEFFVDVDESFGFEYDTTFGIKSFRKDTVLDTTVQIVLFSEELGRNDTSFIQKKNLDATTEWTYVFGDYRHETLNDLIILENKDIILVGNKQNEFVPLIEDQPFELNIEAASNLDQYIYNNFCPSEQSAISPTEHHNSPIHFHLFHIRFLTFICSFVVSILGCKLKYTCKYIAYKTKFPLSFPQEHTKI